LNHRESERQNSDHKSSQFPNDLISVYNQTPKQSPTAEKIFGQSRDSRIEDNKQLFRKSLEGDIE
jgi:hypothetical protein